MSDPVSWFAVRTRSNFESRTALCLQEQNFVVLHPTYKVSRTWSDRTKEINVPLFPGYLFCFLNLCDRAAVLRTPGVVDFIAFGNKPVPIAEDEITAVRKITSSQLVYGPYPFLKAGDRVTIERGVLAGIEGILTRIKNIYRLVVSINVLQRAVAVEIDSDWVRMRSGVSSQADTLLRRAS